MPSPLSNFVTVSKEKRDLLSPASYRSIVELIRGILVKYHFIDLTKNYQKLVDHINNFDDPHLDNKADFFEQIVEGVYAIYVDMLPSPLSLTNFKTQIVPSLGFIELFRRILLNRYLYDQIKRPDGSVPRLVNAYLSNDWMQSGVQSGPVALNFFYDLASERDFIRAGWGKNTQPFPVIFTAQNLTDPPKDLPVLFETSSAAPFFSLTDFGSGFSVPIPASSNDFTVTLHCVGKPQTPTTLFSVANSIDMLSLTMGVDGSVSVTFNGRMLVSSPSASLDGKLTVTVSRFGYLSLETNQAGLSLRQESLLFFRQGIPMVNAMIGIGYEDLTASSFGLRSLVVYKGYRYAKPNADITLPDGYTILADPDGSILFDADGVPLMDYADLHTPPIPPAGYSLLLDDDGSYILEDGGDYVYLMDES